MLRDTTSSLSDILHTPPPPYSTSSLLALLQQATQEVLSTRETRERLFKSYIELAVEYLHTAIYHLYQEHNLTVENIQDVFYPIWQVLIKGDIFDTGFENREGLEKFLLDLRDIVYTISHTPNSSSKGLNIAIRLDIRDWFASIFIDIFCKRGISTELLVRLDFKDLYDLEKYCLAVCVDSGKEVYLQGILDYFVTPETQQNRKSHAIEGLPEDYRIVAEWAREGTLGKGLRILVGNKRLPSISALKQFVLHLGDRDVDSTDPKIAKPVYFFPDGAVGTSTHTNQRLDGRNFVEMQGSHHLSDKFKKMLENIEVFVFDHHPSGAEKLWQPASSWSAFLYCKSVVEFIYNQPEERQPQLLQQFEDYIFTVVLESYNATDLDMLGTPIVLQLMIDNPKWFYDNLSILSEIFFALHAMDNCSGAVPMKIKSEMADLYRNFRGFVFSEAGQQYAYTELCKLDAVSASQKVLKLIECGHDSVYSFVEMVNVVMGTGITGREVNSIPDPTYWLNSNWLRGEVGSPAPPASPQVVTGHITEVNPQISAESIYSLLYKIPINHPSWLQLFQQFGPRYMGYTTGILPNTKDYTGFYKYIIEHFPRPDLPKALQKRFNSLWLGYYTSQKEVSVAKEQSCPSLDNNQEYQLAIQEVLKSPIFEITTPKGAVKILYHTGPNYKDIPTICVQNDIAILVMERPSDNMEQNVAGYGQSVICYGYLNGEMEIGKIYKELISATDSYLRKRVEGVEMSFGGGDVTSGTKFRGLDRRIKEVTPEVLQLMSDFSYLYYMSRGEVRIDNTNTDKYAQLSNKCEGYMATIRDLSQLDFEVALKKFVLDLHNPQATKYQHLLMYLSLAKT